MVKKTTTPNSQPDDFKIEKNIINAETKGIINAKKEDKQSLDNELISHITNSIDLINSKITELNAKYNNLSYESIKNNLQKEANKIMIWVLGVVFIGLLSILGAFGFAFHSIPNEFVVKNNLSKEDIKEIIEYTYQQQSNQKNNI